MAVGLVFQFSSGGQAEYDAVMTNLGLGSPNVEQTQPWPDGIISHVAGATDGGWCVVDVWQSQEHFDRFFAERLGPALEAVGNLPPPTLTPFQVYNTHAGS
jgi:hypothetical protein